MATHVFGDTGGHVTQLIAALEEIGVDTETGHIPQGTHIVHVGDLIHKGSGSDQAVSLLHRIFLNSPERWTQIIGNHEAMHLGLTSRFMWCACSKDALALLREMRQSGFLSLATSLPQYSAVTGDDRDILVTHAGMLHLLWKEAGRPQTAKQAAEHINSHENLYLKPGSVLYGVKDMRSGVFWAESTNELYSSWEGVERTPPFHQIHGHNAIFAWEHNRWFAPLPTFLVDHIIIDKTLRTTVSSINEQCLTMIGIDPGFDSKSPSVDKQPYLTIPAP